ncbi:penicillin-binding protein 2 [uncultured Parolsenella sp.]|uniref:penicillin-binding protein 2 n=1 Tax=uncultured Parolsenella sp. TaxID=2083008 RepID=UPI0025F03AFA|nr:penicillin-binding protein 2 [uncultured Parolsenella sp.]
MGSSTLILIGVVVLVAALAVAAVLVLSRGGARFRLDIGGQAPRAAGGNDTSAENTFKGRLRGLGVFSGSIIGILLARLLSMQLVSGNEYSQQADFNRTRTVTSVAPRGRIFDRNGVELVGNRPSLTVTAHNDVASDDVELQLLANLLGMPKVAAKRKVTDSSQGAQSARTVSVDVTRATVAFIQEHADTFPNVLIEQRTQRAYPQGEVACHLLGYTGTVTQDQIRASQQSGSGLTYESGDTTGQAGVEYQYEEVLQGVRGEQTVYVDANGNVTDYSTSVPPEAGSDVELTIDLTLQKAAEQALADGITRAKRANPTCNSGAAVVIDVTNGEVLAMASAPSFRPELFVGGISQDDWDALSSDDAGNPLMNRVVSGQFVAASTIKPLTTFAALDHGIANVDSGFVCSGWWTGFGQAYGKWCWKHDGHGGIDLRNGITYSCDVVFYEIAKGFYNSSTQDGMQETFRNWGLGSTTGVDLPGEAAGRVPDAEWKWNYFSNYSDADRQWQGGDYTNIAIGQGDILVTPLQMCSVYMGIANRGTVWTPHVLRGVLGRGDNGSMLEYQPKTHVTPTEDPSYMDLVHSGLEGVIYEESASMTAHFTNMTTRVAGKTGTGEHGNTTPTAWFCAFAPADDPKYAISAVIDKGGYGSTSAMYVVRDILGAIFNEPDTSTTSVSDGTR